VPVNLFFTTRVSEEFILEEKQGFCCLEEFLWKKSIMLPGEVSIANPFMRIEYPYPDLVRMGLRTGSNCCPTLPVTALPHPLVPSVNKYFSISWEY